MSVAPITGNFSDSLKRSVAPESDKEDERPIKRQRSCNIQPLPQSVRNFELGYAQQEEAALITDPQAEEKLRDVFEHAFEPDYFQKCAKLSMQYPAIFSFRYLRTTPPFCPQQLTIKYKQLGCQFNFTGKIPLIKHPQQNIECNLEGFRQSFLLSSLRDTFFRFSLSREDLINERTCEYINKSFSHALWDDTLSKDNIKKTYSWIRDPSYSYPILVGSGWSDHSMQNIFFRTKIRGENVLYLLHINRGIDHAGKPGIVILNVKNEKKITQKFIKNLSNSFAFDHKNYKKLENIKKELDANEVAYIKMKAQETNNCVYASLKGALRGLLLIGQCTNSFTEAAILDDPIVENQKQAAKHCCEMLNEYETHESLEDLRQDFDDFDPELFSSEGYTYHYLRLKEMAKRIQLWKDPTKKPKKVSNALLAQILGSIELFECRVLSSSQPWGLVY